MPPDLAKACEVVFQEHKFSADPIPWNKDIFRGRLSFGMSEKAKETLLSKNVIYYPNKAKRHLTLINPEIVTASNFEEAMKWVMTKQPVLTASAVSMSYPVLKPIAATKPLPVAKKADSRPQYVYVSQASVAKPHRGAAELKWHLKPVYYNGLLLAGAAIVGAVIAWLLGTLVSVI